MKILIVEDEQELSKSIVSFLQSEQYVCETAYDYGTALEKIEIYDYACVVLDINLPGGSGMNLLQNLKANNKADGVLIISARNSVDDKIKGLKEGADDYLPKPFYLPELAARIAAIIRRRSFDGNNVIAFGDLVADLLEKTVKYENLNLELTKKEYELFLYFISNKNRVISKGAIVEHLWGDDMAFADNFDLIYTHIKNLRKKMIHAGAPDHIKSVYGTGYKFQTEIK